MDDIPFCSESDTCAIDGTEFEKSFSNQKQQLVPLLKRMRNHCTPVFLYPPEPDADLADARRSLASELADRSYRVLPDRWVNLRDQLREASLAVFLNYDRRVRELADAASQQQMKWVAWCSP